MWKKTLLTIFIICLMVGLSGCIRLTREQESQANPGGVFISGDKGETWTRKVDLMTAGAIAGKFEDSVDVVNFTFDPTDNNYIYLGTPENGLYYSNNNGKGWIHVEGISSGFVRGVAIDHRNPCVVYVAVNTRLMKTTTCTRTWEESYKAQSSQLVTAVGIDFFNPDILYIGTDTGDLIKSLDAGLNWERIKNFPSRVNFIKFDKDDSRHLYVGTEKSYLHISTDAGASWTDTREFMREEFNDSNRALDLVQDPKTGTIYYATEPWLLRSNDKGETWEEVKLLTVPKQTRIYSLAINPNNGNEFYYATGTNIYRTWDAGQTWANWRLPTRRAGRAIAVHPDDENVVYLGVRLYEQ